MVLLRHSPYSKGRGNTRPVSQFRPERTFSLLRPPPLGTGFVPPQPIAR